MSDAGFTSHSLRECLAGLSPVELKGMTLLRERRPLGHFFPQMTHDQPHILRVLIAEAITEIVDYTERCHRAAQQLATLTPVALTTFSIMEYGI